MARAEVQAILRLKDELTATSRRAADSLNKLNKNVEKQQTTLGGLQLKWFAIAGAVTGVVNVMKQSLDAHSKQIDAINKLNLALSNQGNLLPGTSERLQEYASALQRSSTFGDEVILQNQALLASFGMNEAQIRTTTQVALDFAAATGRDLSQAVNLLGKAFVGETGELSRYGVIIDKNIPKSEKFSAVIEQLSTRFGGQAQAATETFSGKMEQLGNALGDLSESFGKFIGQLFDSQGSFDWLIGAVERVSLFFGRDLVIALGEARALFGEFIAAYLDGVAKLVDALDYVLPGLDGVADKIREWADNQREIANAFREESDAAAMAAGATIDFANAATTASSSGAALKRTVDGITTNFEHLRGLTPPIIQDFRVLRSVGAEMGSTFEEEINNPFSELSTWLNTLPNEIDTTTKQAGALTQQTYSWAEATGQITQLMGDAGNILSVFGVNIDGVIGKVTRLVSSFTSLFGTLNNLFGMFGKLSGDGLGGLGGLSSAFGGALKSIGSFVSGLGPLGIGLGAAAAGVGALIGKLFGGPSNFERAGKELSQSFGSEFDEGLRWHLVNVAENLTGGDFQEAIQRNLGEVFKRATETIEPGELDELAKRARDTFAFLERGEIDTSEAGKILQDALAQLMPHFDEMGEAGQSALQGIVDDAMNTGVQFEGLIELAERLKAELAILGATGLPGLTTPTTGGAPDTASAQSGMFKRLKRDTVIFAHAGELAAIIPKGMDVVSAQRGFPRRGRPTGMDRRRGSRPGAAGGGGSLPETDGGISPTSSGGGSQVTEETVRQVAREVAVEVAAAVQPSIEVTTPTQLNIQLPEISQNRGRDIVEEFVLPEINRALKLRQGEIYERVRQVARSQVKPSARS